MDVNFGQVKPRITDRGFTVDSFLELLDEAEIGAVTQWEMGFVYDMTKRFETYQLNTSLSDEQERVLRKLANR